MSLIKDVYSRRFFDELSGVLAHELPEFNKKDFLRLIYDDVFEKEEWKDRMLHITRALQEVLPAKFPSAVKIIINVIKRIRQDTGREGGLEHVVFPHYIAAYGLADFDTSINAFEFITQFVSCEFAVRPFIIQYQQKMIDTMITWSGHKSPAVRRLSSEGSRPRLPWAMAIPFLKKDPTPILPILENLKNDPDESVRRSVANNLNDIAKDHPDLVIGIGRKWRGGSKETDAIIKHGSRTLLKKGHEQILKEYGLDSTDIAVRQLQVLKALIRIGENLDFSFIIHNNNQSDRLIRLEYGIYYLKNNGQLARKVFKISERLYQPGAEVRISRKQSFRLITTRKFYPGKHKLSIIINGLEMATRGFEIQ